ncbi:MAG: alpha/beta fold hydrolase [Cryomorphaceae bacterium]
MTTEVRTKNNVNVLGEGTQPMVFAHGYGCDQNMWRHLVPAFSADYKIVLFDHVGSGNSDESVYDFKKYNNLKGYADDVIELLDELEMKNAVFVGHSVSCIIGVLAAAKRPDLFNKLILIGPSPCYVNKGDYHGGFSQEDIDELVETLESNYLGWSSFITPIIAGDTEQPEVSEELHNSFCRMNPKIAKHFARVTFTGDNREDLKRVSTPSFVIQSDPDTIAPVEVGEYVCDQIPDARIEVLHSPGHCPHLTAPEKTIDAIKSYLKKSS